MKLTCLAYRIPFKKPLKTSAHSYDHREGWILCWEESQEQFFAEAAPLPGFSTSNIQDITNCVHQYIEEWKQLLSQDDPIQHLRQHYTERDTPPALQFALDSLAYQIEAHRANIRLSEFLFDHPIPHEVPVNGLVSLMDKDDVIAAVQGLVDKGFKTIKCKVGNQFKREKEILFHLREAFPNILIRLDANQAWNILDAINHLHELEQLNIQYCEEPLAVPAPSTFQALSKTTNIPLALDESINTSDNWKSLLSNASVLVVKPMLIGSFKTLFDIKLKSEQANCDLVFTSSLETSIGRGVVALLASGMSSQGYAQGLDTGRLFRHDMVPNQPVIQNGSLKWNIHSLPVKADIRQLKKYSTSTVKSS